MEVFTAANFEEGLAYVGRAVSGQAYVVLQPQFWDNDYRIDICGMVRFTFASQQEYIDQILQVVQAVAHSARDIHDLEFMVFGKSPIQLKQMIDEFTNVGHWVKGLNKLIIWYWDFGSSACSFEDWNPVTVPNTIKMFEFNGHSTENVQRVATNLTSFLCVFPRVDAAKICLPFADHGSDAILMQGLRHCFDYEMDDISSDINYFEVANLRRRLSL